jgi:hypothetical protein
MNKVEFITYSGKKILVEDFSSMKPGTDFIDQLNIARKMIASQAPKSVLALFDVSGTSFNSMTLEAMKEFTRNNTTYIKAAGVVGINGLLQIALATISKFAGREFITFKTRQECLDWLVRQ